MNETTGALGPPASLMNTALRMVIPFRREFDRALDVQSFLENPVYAKEVIDQALQSQNPKLRQYANDVSAHVLGPRNGPDRQPNRPVTAPSSASAASPAAAPAVSGASASLASAEEAARQQVLNKYRTGLR